jgi:hypothetical protein
MNMAAGSRALFSNTMGSANTVSGHVALSYNIIGIYNTPSSAFAPDSNATGFDAVLRSFQEILMTHDRPGLSGMTHE